VTPQACFCERSDCRKCRQRRYYATWRDRHPNYKHPPVPVKGYVPPAESRMDRIADEVWARHAAPWYYAPAAERFRGWGPTAGVMRVETR